MCKATFFSLILTCAATLLQDEEVENPKYRAWSEFKPNSWVTYEQPWGVDGKRRETQKLVEISKEKVILELAVVENGLEFPVYRTVIPCTLKSQDPEYALARHPHEGKLDIPGPAGWKITSLWQKSSEGDEEIEVAGKKLKCHWIKIDHRIECTLESLNEKGAAKTWYSKEIPGQVANLEMTQRVTNYPFLKNDRPPHDVTVTRITKAWKRE